MGIGAPVILWCLIMFPWAYFEVVKEEKRKEAKQKEKINRKKKKKNKNKIPDNE